MVGETQACHCPCTLLMCISVLVKFGMIEALVKSSCRGSDCLMPLRLWCLCSVV